MAISPPLLKPDPLTVARAQQRLLEQSTQFSDSVFCEQQWVRHHSWSRYLPEPSKLLRLIAALFPPLLWVVLVSLGCGIYQELKPANWWNLKDNNLAFAYAITAFALSLVLVFKTNASYGRWCEAQAAWFNVETAVYNLVHKIQAFTPDHMTAYQKKLFVRWVIALPHLLRSHLMSYTAGTLALETLLPEKEHAWLQLQTVMPLAAVQIIGGLVSDLKLGTSLEASVQVELSAYVAAMGVCSRLQKAPVPMSYTRHTVRFLIVYCSLLALALWPSCEWFTLAIAPGIAFLLLALENITIVMENPLFILPMAAYCMSIHVAVMSMTKAWALEKPQCAKAFQREQVRLEELPDWQLKRRPSLRTVGLAVRALSEARYKGGSVPTSLDVGGGLRSADCDKSAEHVLASARHGVEGDWFNASEALSMATACIGDLPMGEDDEVATSYAARSRELSGGSPLYKRLSASVRSLRAAALIAREERRTSDGGNGDHLDKAAVLV